MLGDKPSPGWLATDAMLLQFSTDRSLACQHFAAFVMAGFGVDVWANLNHQIYLGDDAFVVEQKVRLCKTGKCLSEIPHRQRRKPAEDLAFYRSRHESHEEAVYAVFRSDCYTQKTIADYFGLYYSTISKMIAP